MSDCHCPSSTLFHESIHFGRGAGGRCGDVHDKSDRAMSKHFVRCQLPRSFFSACGLDLYDFNVSLENFDPL